MDVNAIHQGYLRGLKARGGKITCNAEVTRCERIGADWEIEASGMAYRAPIVINAAGAWCDVIAGLTGARKIGLQPKRRSAFIFAPPEGMATAHWPMVFGTGESFYFKPDAGMLLGSPANEDPVDPQDVQDSSGSRRRADMESRLRLRWGRLVRRWCEACPFQRAMCTSASPPRCSHLPDWACSLTARLPPPAQAPASPPAAPQPARGAPSPAAASTGPPHRPPSTAPW